MSIQELFKQKIKISLKVFFSFFAFIMISRLFTSEALNLSRDLGYVFSFSILFTSIIILWNNNKKHLILCFVFVGIYLLSALSKLDNGMILIEREITHTIGFSLILFSCFSLTYYTAHVLQNKYLKIILNIISTVFCVLFILPALLFLGYEAVNHGILSSDIILTLFQTNPEEVIAYLKDKNLYIWGFGWITIIVFIVFYIYLMFTLKKPKFNASCYIFALFWLMYLGYAVLPKLNLCFVVNIIETTKATLDSFDDFKVAQKNRLARLQNLMNMQVQAKDKGVYVLVIGESETRDHMQLYGYSRKTTPWLSKFALNKNTIVIQNAYANHTHTVPTLTYALSEKNQYNNVELKDAFSLIEVAKTAGFKTYWLSNQSKYEVIGTPVTIIASLADEQRWLNTNAGDKIFTSYYDEKLVDYIPSTEDNDKILIIIHLMGSHSSYGDRYPKSFQYFHDNEQSIDAYDNSILYNDFVLQKIYNKVKNYPNFMAFVYFSDHGDDVDNDLGHESSRFSHRMARIPCIINVSENFAQLRRTDLLNLQNNQNAYWSNDLLYDLMVSLMKIDGMPNLSKKFDLLSDQYNMSEKELKLLHGAKQL